MIKMFVPTHLIGNLQMLRSYHLPQKKKKVKLIVVKNMNLKNLFVKPMLFTNSHVHWEICISNRNHEDYATATSS